MVNHMSVYTRVGLSIRVRGVFTGRQAESGTVDRRQLSRRKSYPLGRNYDAVRMLIDSPTRDIADILHNEPRTFQNRCLVAKSWIPRTRLHPLAQIWFFSVELLEARKIFLNPSASPAYHTHSLTLSCPQVVTAADAEEGGRIRSFSRVVYLYIDSTQNPSDSLPPRSTGSRPPSNLSPCLLPDFKTRRSSTSSLSCPFSKI